MTTGARATLVDGWLDGLTYWVQLHTGDPGAAGTANACTGSVGGVRKQSTMAASSGGSKAQSSGGSWASWDGGSVTITHISCWSLITGGTLNFTAALASGKAIANGDTYNHTTLTVSIGPVAA